MATLLVFSVNKPFETSFGFDNSTVPVKHYRGDVFTSKDKNENIKLLENKGFIKFKQKLVW